MPRETERISLLTEISLESTAGNRQERISDLSIGGCFVESIVPVNTGETVKLKFMLPTGKSLSLSGEVAYTMVEGFGVRFINLSDDDLKSLSEAIGTEPN